MGSLSWLKITVALTLLGGMLLSAKLWLTSHSYPLEPVFEGLPAVPPLVGRIWFIALLSLLVAIVIVRRPRTYIFAFLLLAGLLCLLDQSRWQPWFYQGLFMLAALAVYPWDERDPKQRETALNVCRLIVASIYFWSGLQKLNASFVEGIFPWLVEPLIALLPRSSEELIYQLGILVPFVEAGIGVGLLTRYRNMAVVLALSMHAFILFSLGPFGHDWNLVVWPWNIAMTAFIIILFWRTESFSAEDILVPRTSLFHGLVLLLFGVMPLFSFFGLWDSYLSASLYSGNTKDGTIYLSEAVKNGLPDTISGFALQSGEAHSTDVISIDDWSWQELHVPAYPEARIFKNVSRYICTYAKEPSEVTLTIEEKPSPIDGSREAETYDCSDLETAQKIQELQ